MAQQSTSLHTDDIASSLQKFRIFENTKEAELVKIAEILTPLEFEGGQTIISKGDEGESMYFIDFGAVVVSDEAVELSRLGPGEVFGEYSLIDTQTRSATVKALKSTRVWRLNQKDFLDLVMNDMSIMRSFLNVFVNRLRQQDVLQQQLHLQNAEISKSNEALEQLNKEKDQLMRILAHDIRNPLSSATSLTEVLKEELDNLEQEHRDCLDMISSSMRRINELVEQMLRGYSASKKEISTRIEKAPLHQLLENAIRNFQPQIRDKSLQLESAIDEVSVPTDKYLVQQIYDNLLSNAIKYSPRSGTITVRLYETDQEVITEFGDEGQGLTTEDQNKLFVEFQTLSARPTAGESSFGLGLSIVKKFADKLRGRVWCESTYGEGACFSVALPLDPVD